MIYIILIIILILLPIPLGVWKLNKKLGHRIKADNTNENKYNIQKTLVKYKTKDDIQITAWLIKAKKEKAYVILIHGFNDQGSGKAEVLAHAKYLTENNYSVVIPDLRANGESEGTKTYLGTKEWLDIEATYDYIKDKINNDIKIGCLGISMGAVTAINFLGKTNKGDFLIASVPYKSIDSILNFRLRRNTLINIIIRSYTKYISYIYFGGSYKKYEPLTTINNIKVPKLIIGAKKDKSVDYKDAEQLYKTAPKPKEYWEANSGHDVFNELPEEFENKVIKFLQTNI